MKFACVVGSKIKHMTAEELSLKYFGGMHYDDITIEYIQKYAIDFARLKVQEALEAAAEKARVKTIIPIEHGCRMFTDAYEDVDRDSILNAYDLNNIV